MLHHILLIFISYSLIYCSAEIDSKVTGQIATKTSDEDDVEEEITAVPPTIISGAHLVCLPESSDESDKSVSISCHFEKDGEILKGLEIDETDFSISDEAGNNLILASKKNDDGKYIFKVLETEADIKITLASIAGEPIDGQQQEKIDMFADVVEHEEIELFKEEYEKDSLQRESSIEINRGADYTNSEAVRLTLVSPAADEMYLTNNPGCQDGGLWEGYAEAKDWTLAQTNATATIYVKFRAKSGNESECLSDSIVHDNTPPAETSIAINAGADYVASSSVALTLVAEGAAQMYLSNTPDCQTGGSWEEFSSEKTWSLSQSNGEARVYVKFMDLAGNQSDCINDSIIHDDTPPSSASLTIAASEYTAVSSVTLFPSADGASEMYITNTAGCESGGAWEEYESTKAWTLGETNTLTNVYIKSRDQLGHETTCVSDSITHDDVLPLAPTDLEDGSYTSSASNSPSISWSAPTGGEADIAYYELSIGTTAGDDSVKSWEGVGNVTTKVLEGLSLESGDTYFVNVRSVDLAGNNSAVSSSDGFVYNYCLGLENSGSWVLVPGDGDYATDDFCVMKYEAKNNGGSPSSVSSGTPWVSINQGDAKAKCESLGAGYHLITNPEWMTIAANAAGLGSNWSSGSVGGGELARGHSDEIPNQVCGADADDAKAYVDGSSCSGLSSGTFNQRRTHYLSNGEVVWDLSGNVYDMVDYFNKDDKPGVPSAGYITEFPAVTPTATTPLSHLIPTNAVKSYWNDSWDKTQSIGMYWRGDSGTKGVLVRGGEFDDSQSGNTVSWAGLFAADFDVGLTETRTDTGFRCTVSVP